MSGHFGNNLIDEVKERCDIVDVIGKAVQLKRAGSNYKGLCPFHNEKTPSFVVSPQKQIFTCFGCGATGNVISFVMQYYGLEFMPAVEKLANEYGIDISRYQTERIKNKEEYYRINKDAAVFFFKALRSGRNPGYTYMLNRGISAQTMHRFGIGYADSSWDSLYRHMIKLGHDEKKLLELGLISESKNRYFDKFRNRVIFPIINTSGKIIGFGGRVLDEGTPKYLNSPETPVFSKKNNLYALNITRKEIEKQKRAVLVEGYMDVISLYQGGIENVTASLGTALTENQTGLLKRYLMGGEIVISYDSDDAGKRAALRALDIIGESGVRAKVLSLDDGKDPDEYIKNKGRNAFDKLIENAVPLADYKLQLLTEKYNTEETDGRVRFMKEAVSVLKQLSPVEADLYIKKLSAAMNISEGAIRSEYEGKTDILINKPPENPEGDEKKETGTLEKNIIKLLLYDEKYIGRFAQYENILKTENTAAIYSGIKEQYMSSDRIDINRLKDTLNEDERRLLDDITVNVMISGHDEEIYEDCVKRIKDDFLREKENLLLSRLSMADDEANRENIREIMEQLIEIRKLRM